MSVTVLPRVPSSERAEGTPSRRRRAGRLVRSLRPTRSLSARLIGLVGVMAIVSGGWWASNSPLFDLRTLSVTGAHHLSQEDVARLAGLRGRTNVLWISTSTVARRLQADPWILEARVSRTLPSTITIAIEERRAVAVLMPAGQLVAQDGVLLGAGGGARLPRIEGAIDRPASGLPRAAPSPALTVVQALPVDLVRQVAQVAMDPTEGITVYLRSGTRVIYGDASAAAAKAAGLQSVLDWAERTGTAIDYVDVRAPGAPALMPRGVAGQTP